MQGVIIAYFILYNEPWPEIEKMTRVKADEARHLMNTLAE
jgi:hypothetical protein